jgi:hypothetical protein
MTTTVVHCKKENMIEGEDFYFDKGRKVMTAKYLLSRGKCCHHGCRHCPWKRRKKVDKEQILTYTKQTNL